jgi:VCBS repeat-containing protein
MATQNEQVAHRGMFLTAVTPATTGTMTVNLSAVGVITITPTGACTFNASGGVSGQIVTFSITTSGTTSYTLTFGTNFKKVSTLATGTTSGRMFAVTFRCIDGTVWQEICRTAAQT